MMSKIIFFIRLKHYLEETRSDVPTPEPHGQYKFISH